MAKNMNPIVAGAAIALVLTGCGEPQRPLQTRVLIEGGAMYVWNWETFPWGECDVDINGDYSISVKAIPPGSAPQTYRLADFVKRDGTRFNILTTKPLTTSIYCRETPYGTMAWAGQWR